MLLNTLMLALRSIRRNLMRSVLTTLGIVIGVAAVVTTSRWTRRWLLGAYGLDPARVVVAVPGVQADSDASPDQPPASGGLTGQGGGLY